MSAIPTSNLPTPEQYADALRQLRGTSVFNKIVELMLEHHYHCADRTATYGELARAAGYNNYKIANAHYGKFCHELGNALGFAFLPSGARNGQDVFYGSVIGEGAGSGEYFRLRMYPTLAKAIALLGWYQQDLLEALRPKTMSAVIDLVRLARIDVSAWAHTEDGREIKEPRSNPRYCYDWSFGSRTEGYALCVWHESLKSDGGNVVFSENMQEFITLKRRAAHDPQLNDKARNRAEIHARRGTAFFEACKDSYESGLPVRVILNAGTRRERENLDETSIVSYRELDPEKWYVHRFNDSTGNCLVVRGIPPQAAADDDLAPVDDDDSPGADDRRRWAEIKARQGQPKFRETLLNAYGRRCAVTGTVIVEILEAAHIVPHVQGVDYRVQNGLLLRADIHTLFDLYLLSIDDRMRIHLSRTLRNTEYWNSYQGKELRLPRSTLNTPDFSALQRRHLRFLEEESKRL